jgi:hypothetical protein
LEEEKAELLRKIQKMEEEKAAEKKYEGKGKNSSTEQKQVDKPTNVEKNATKSAD